MGVSLGEAQFDKSNASDDAAFAAPSARLAKSARAKLSSADYARGSKMLAPGGELDKANQPSPEPADVDQDAEMSDSMLVAGIQPGAKYGWMEGMKNAGARHWYQGRMGFAGGPQGRDENSGGLALPYDDTTTQAADIERVQRFGRYASGEVSWDEIESEDPRGAAEIEELVPQFISTAAAGGVIYAHSGGGAATMAGLRRLLDTPAGPGTGQAPPGPGFGSGHHGGAGRAPG